MAVAKIWDQNTSTWVPALIGAQGPTGPTGLVGPTGPETVVVSATAPVNTDVLWADTSDPGDASIPPGGTAGQALVKIDSSNYNTQWLSIALDTPVVTTLTPTTGTVNLDFSSVHNKYLTHALTGNVSYTTSNRSAGKSVTIRITSGASSRTLAFPSWVFIGGAAPSSIASNKTGVLTVTFFGSADTDAVAAWAVQP